MCTIVNDIIFILTWANLLSIFAFWLRNRQSTYTCTISPYQSTYMCTISHITYKKYFLDLSLMYMCTRNIMYTTKCTQITMFSTRKVTNVHSSPKPCVYLPAYIPFSVGLDLFFYLFGILIKQLSVHLYVYNFITKIWCTYVHVIWCTQLNCIQTTPENLPRLYKTKLFTETGAFLFYIFLVVFIS